MPASSAGGSAGDEPPPYGASGGPTTGERGPTTGERGPTTGERGPTTGERGPTTGERGPTTGERGPTTGERGPTTGDRRAGARPPPGALELALFGPDPEIGDTVPAIATGLAPSRRYVGNEFCEHLLERAPAVVRALADDRARGFCTSVVLPPVGPAAWEAARAVLAAVAEAAPGTEIVANDWGVLAAAARDERLVPVLGRCLNRMLRDPRLEDALGPGLPAAASEALGGGPWASAAFARLRARMRIARLELDVPPVPVATACFPADLPLSLWVPYGYVATGRVCLAAGVHRAAGAGRFAPGPCRRECQQAHVALSAPRSVQGPCALALHGNTVFLTHDETLAARALEMAATLPVDRIVWQTRVPMRAGVPAVRPAAGEALGEAQGSVRP